MNINEINNSKNLANNKINMKNNKYEYNLSKKIILNKILFHYYIYYILGYYLFQNI